MKSPVPFIAVLLYLCLHQTLAQELNQRIFTGTINGKIPIKLTLTTDGSVAFGQVIYTKKNLPITIVGSVENGNLFLNELLPDGQVTGLYSAVLKDSTIKGTWMSPAVDAKTLMLDLVQNEQKQVSRSVLKSVTGNYVYSFGKNGSVGNMRVVQNKPDQITVRFDNMTSAPARNQAVVSKTVLKLIKNQAVYSSSEFGACKFTITFIENSARVNYTDEAYQCGFGNAATVTGNYIKTKTGAK